MHIMRLADPIIKTGVILLLLLIPLRLGEATSIGGAGVSSGKQTTGNVSITGNLTVSGPSTLSDKHDRNDVAVNDDSCVGEQGLWWYDTTDSQFEFCNENTGTPARLLDSDTEAMLDSFGGMAYTKPDLTIVNDSGLKLDIETIGGGDMYFQIDGIKSTLDCTTGAGVDGKARVSLTAGSDANTPSTNYIYVTDSGGTATLAASTSLPTGAFGWIGKIVIPDATTWATTGAYGLQRYTEAFENSSRGALSHAREKLRALGAVYISGVSQTLDITVNGGAADNVHLATGSGSVYQLHRQTYPAFSTGPYYYGNGPNIYEHITDLNAALAESDGTSLSGTRYNLVIWGAVNLTTGESKLFVNLPNGSYNNNNQARNDRDNTADYTVPDDMRSVAFMVSRLALRPQTASSGTWTELGVYSLLGTPPGARSGGAGAVASNEFDDSQFLVFDDGDNTKQIALQASGITTGNTRTLTVQDKSYTIADAAIVATNTAKVTNATHTGDVTGSTALAIAADVIGTAEMSDADHGDVAWSAGVASVQDLTITSEAQGDILYFDGSNWIRIAKGTAGQVLEMNAGATAPEWDTDDTGGGGSSRWTDEPTFSRTDDNTISITATDCTDWQPGTPLRFSSAGAPSTYYYAMVDTCTGTTTLTVDIFGHPIEIDKDDNLEWGVPEALSHKQLTGVGNCAVSDTWFPKYFWTGQDAYLIAAYIYVDTQATGAALELNVEMDGTNALDAELSLAVSTTQADSGTTIHDATYANALIEQEEFVEIDVSQCGSTVPGGNAAWIKLIFVTP